MVASMGPDEDVRGDYSRNVKTVAVAARVTKQENAGALALNTAPLLCADDRTAVGSTVLVEETVVSAEDVSATVGDTGADVAAGSIVLVEETVVSAGDGSATVGDTDADVSIGSSEASPCKKSQTTGNISMQMQLTVRTSIHAHLPHPRSST